MGSKYLVLRRIDSIFIAIQTHLGELHNITCIKTLVIHRARLWTFWFKYFINPTYGFHGHIAQL